MQPTAKRRLTKTVTAHQDDWFDRYRSITIGQPHHILLESGRGGRFHIIGLSPNTVLKGKDDMLEIQTRDQQTEQTGDLLELVQNYLRTTGVAIDKKDLPDFTGGAIGYISYDVARQIERLPDETTDDLAMPDVYFVLFDEYIVLDKVTNELTLMVFVDEKESDQAPAKLEALEQKWNGPLDTAGKKRNDAEPSRTHFPPYSLDETEFMEAVKRVQEYIRSGDVFQVNLSVRQSQLLKTEPIDIYKHLRTFNPSPYMGYFHTPEFQLVNGSPELLVKKQGNLASTRPIAGTRSRGRDDAEDEALAKSLIENEKERAEHVMLVDLERNDLGRVCQYGTVEVNEFMVIEKYSHVMHIVSNVQGTLRDNQEATDVIRATFPGGTITGAPKVRTMEIIEELEPVRRGVYTGSIGWIGFDGNMEMNIAIRTMVCKDGWAHVQAGAGIVIDSDPKAEYKESLKKAKALWHAKELSEQVVNEVAQQ